MIGSNHRVSLESMIISIRIHFDRKHEIIKTLTTTLSPDNEISILKVS